MSDVSAGVGSTGPPPRENTRRPVGVVVASLVDGVGTLITKQVELAKIEASEAVAERAKGVGLMAAAGVLVVLGVGFAGAAASAALDLVLPRWAANLIVAAVFALVGGVLVLAGRRAIRTAPTPERTQETLKEDARWAKRQLAR